MELREFENLNIKSSLLGFGCMRFPLNEKGKIDEARAEKMLDDAFKAGVTYFDTAVPYHDGDSEPFLGRVLDKYERSSYLLATKLPLWDLNSKDDVRRIFNAQLKKLNKEYFDFYLLHAINKERFDKIKELGIIEECEQLKKEGKIKYFGFSFHDNYAAFEEIITYKKWDFCQLQINYMDQDDQAGLKGLKLAERLGVPVIIMEPVKGGQLATLPEDVVTPFKAMNKTASTASWAFRWIGSFPNVKVILSGMSTEEQVYDNLATFTDFKPLTEEEFKAVEQVRKALVARVKNGCTGCRYCMPCPAGVDIPKNFTIWNTYGVYENKEQTSRWWKDCAEEKQAKNCIGCGKCETLCPQKLPIRTQLTKLQQELDALTTEEQ